MAEIRNIVFDFGGVFNTVDMDGITTAFRSLGFFRIGEYLSRYTQKGFFGDLEAGRISDREFCRCVSREAGREVSWQECQKALLAFLGELIMPNLDEVLKLRKDGYRQALLSNTNPFVAAWFHSQDFDGRGHSLDYYFPRRNQYLSFEQKCMKPDSRIFLNMLRSTGFSPRQTLFVDDGEKNLETAEALGIHTFLARNREFWGPRLETALRGLSEAPATAKDKAL